MSRVTDLLKGAVELNLRYTSTLLHLSKDYLKDAGEVLTRDDAPAPPPATAPARAPLLIAGRSGDLANAAFAINNPGDKPIQVHLLVQGELGDERVRLDPARFSLDAGKGTIVRIVVPIDDKLEAERDHPGTVVAPGLAAQGVPFIVRRLAAEGGGAPDAAPPSTATDAPEAPEASTSAPRTARAKR
ncbi:conserved hypothetical protein [Rubrivivax sp. A210]|uniref:hypothetical protein n=1 Tax=Rubrivivax sp. A210 TaxID=2772301 RepID=UPI001917CAAF|nr:hypothetical protein [Rubrivivax sp. A210]CAD5371607.1 conserved hypothetical protein [Rubrivivax sp. A210]